MNNIVSHAVHLFPRSLGMLCPKLFGKHIGCLTKNFDILDHCIIHHVVSDKIIKVFPFGVPSDSFYRLKHVFKAAFVSTSFSHRLIFCHALPIPGQKEARYLPIPNRLFCLRALPNHSTFQRTLNQSVCSYPRKPVCPHHCFASLPLWRKNRITMLSAPVVY